MYGQNLLVFGSDLRVSFYFIGMALVQAIVSFILFKLIKNIATSYYLFMCVGELFNQSVFEGEYSYIEITFGLCGIAYVLIEKPINKWILKK